MNLTEIDVQSKFSEAIREYFYQNKPKKVVETGTYHGNGSTRLIASLLRDIPLDWTQFYSIECNMDHVGKAVNNLNELGLSQFVKIYNGLSVPKELIPNIDDIKKEISRASKIPEIKIDHSENIEKAHEFYYLETGRFENDDWLGKLIPRGNYHADFVLLDSAGHMGFIEFEYLLTLLEEPCVIALDDTKHLKHYRSREWIMNDNRFEILFDSDEKFGSMMARYNPNL